MIKMSPSFKTLLNYAAIFTIFTAGWSYDRMVAFAEVRLMYFMIPLILLLWMPILRGLHFNRVFLIVFSAVTIFSVYSIWAGDNKPNLFLKQFIGIAMTAFFFYLLLKVNRYDVKGMFKIYLNIALVIALIGIVQEASYLIGFKPGYDFSYIMPPFWRISLTNRNALVLLQVNSILPEPSHFCNVMTPAFFVSLASFLKDSFRFQARWKSLIIIAAYLLASSTTGYIAVLFCLLLVAYNYRKARYIIAAGLIMCALFSFLYCNSVEFRMRIASSLDVLTGKKEAVDTNQSTFAFFTNAQVACYSLMNNPLFGGGIGSHQVSYDKEIGKRIPDLELSHPINRKDAASMFLRLISETGLFGTLAFLFFIFKFHLPMRRDRTSYMWVINNAILAMFFIKLLRMGHYFIDGFFLFFWIYYFTYKLGITMQEKPVEGIETDEDTSYLLQPGG